MYATRIPPHLVVAVNGKVFTLTIKGAMVDSELSALLKLIRKDRIATIFIRLAVPTVFTMDDLEKEIRKYTLAYPRVDIGIATCLAPVRDFCSLVYHTGKQDVNFIYELLPRLEQNNAISSSFHLNLEDHLSADSFALKKYSMNDIHEGIRRAYAGVGI